MTAIWKGVRGPVTDPVSGKKVPALPVPNQLAPVNDHNIALGFWPQYFIGAFPNCFKITESAGHEMGQAPGTHWYHAHKHGSTSINLYNGLAGAMIIEGDYDKQLAAIPGLNLKATEKVMVVQQFNDLPDLERPVQRNKVTFTNGSPVAAATTKGQIQTAPAITMRPGEIQLWRIVNAQVQTTITAAFSDPSGATTNLPTFRQVAQDGVQFSLENYKAQPLTAPDGNKNGTRFTLAPGGRIDMLVQAPPLAGNYQLGGVVNLTVAGDPVQPAQNYPTDGQFPVFPKFLDNIGECQIKRTVTFGWEPYRVNAGPAKDQNTHGQYDATANPPVKLLNIANVPPSKTLTIGQNMAPYFTIDNEQFREDKYYKTMILGDEEEWTIFNTTNAPHPFHIHVNPFQVLEVFDPNVSSNPVKYANPPWFDVIIIPAGLKQAVGPNKVKALVLGPDNNAATPGWVRIRTRFADFTGSYVLHCHILAHEDRGMMQLVRVIDKATPLKHH
jgi:FtsP/CotA-like multicopper oxidase with cupredoxin domain